MNYNMPVSVVFIGVALGLVIGLALIFATVR
ncbi:MAG: hypothetical protein UX54_C0004G0007 [Parcubacteria group bacterium GW2011_GWA2_46_39]|nr:MAG: hypothetical protein UX54_C0004G0007 [Parcubacteria group bacterium GW2011_GWA2_46_39]